MKLAPIEYLRPRTESELLSALALHGADAAVLSGGQSLMPELALRARAPKVIVDINHLDLACDIAKSGPDGELRIGALVRHRDVTASPVVRQHAPLMAAAASHIGNPAVRNRGTVCGSIAHADPAAEFPLLAVAMNARVCLRAESGERLVPAEAFFTGAFSTVRRPDEYVAALHLPCAGAHSIQFFDEISRRPTAPAVASVALIAEGSPAGLPSVRLAFGGVSDRPRLLAATGMSLSRRPEDADRARDLLRAELAPWITGDDVSYRLHLAVTLLERARAALCLRLKENFPT